MTYLRKLALATLLLPASALAQNPGSNYCNPAFTEIAATVICWDHQLVLPTWPTAATGIYIANRNYVAFNGPSAGGVGHIVGTLSHIDHRSGSSNLDIAHEAKYDLNGHANFGVLHEAQAYLNSGARVEQLSGLNVHDTANSSGNIGALIGVQVRHEGSGRADSAIGVLMRYQTRTGSAIGLSVEDQPASVNATAAVQSAISAGPGRYGLRMDGTAPSVFQGPVQVGSGAYLSLRDGTLPAGGTGELRLKFSSGKLWLVFPDGSFKAVKLED